MIHFQIQLGTAAGEASGGGVDNEMVLGLARASFLIGAGHQEWQHTLWVVVLVNVGV